MPTAVTQAFITAGTALLNGTAYVLAENVTMTAPFPIAGSGAGVTFDGSGHTVTVPDLPNKWPGLFSKAVSVSNLGILSSGSTQDSAGWFFKYFVGGTATNCYSTGVIGKNGGGIFGYGSTGSIATNCYSTGNIVGLYAGGIFGWAAGTGIYGPANQNVLATNCYSTGNMIGRGSGGIIGGYSASASAINCYSTGTLVGLYASPIFGEGSSGITTNCYSTNGGLWSDTAANAANALTGVPGQPSPVWLRYNNVIDTPYLLVANPQPPSDDVNLLTVVVNGSTRVASNGAYAYTFDSSASTIPVLIRSQDPHAIVSIQDLSGGGDVSGNLTLVPGTNSFTIQVVSDSGVATATYPLTIQTLSNDDDISLVFVNGATVDISNGVYDVTLYSFLASIPVRIITDDQNARIAIEGTDLSGTHDLSGSLSLPMTGPNSFIIAVVAPNGANATYLLTIRNPTLLIDQAFINAGAVLFDNTHYTMTENVTMTTSFPFDGNGSGITFEGSGHTITVPNGSAYTWPGLFNKPITVQNLGVIVNGNGGLSGHGLFFSASVGGSATNCYSAGSGSLNYGGGGIFGGNSPGTAYKCFSTKSILSGGGIFGSGSSGTATACFSTGSAVQSTTHTGGGIFGHSSSGTARNCYSTGTTLYNAGGIFGSHTNSAARALHCYSAVYNRNYPIFGAGSNIVESVNSPDSGNSSGWSDSAANSYLEYTSGGPPTRVWYSAAANTPYRLNPTVPDAPTGVSATSGVNASSVVSWTAPASNGGSVLTGYTVTSSPGGLTATTTGATSVTVTGLTNGTSYTFTVTATNLLGTGAASAASTSITPLGPPGAPTLGSVAPTTDRAVLVSWSAPASNGGTPITAYTVTSTPGGITATTAAGTTSTTVTNLTNGTAYTFTVTATNSQGTGSASAASASVTPSRPITQAFIDAGTALDNTNTYRLTSNVIMTTPFTFSGSGANITLDGCDYNITVTNNASWPGLFSKPVTVHNLGVVSNGSVLYSNGSTVFAGWFFTSGTGGSATKCFSTGNINGSCGGIFANNSNGTATNCYSIGQIGENGGGIFGSYSIGSATNCFSTGTINDQGGGMFGLNSAGTATNCYSTGEIVSYAGGIFGSQAGAAGPWLPRPATVINCYSRGTYNADLFTDGIFGGSPVSVSKQNEYAANGQWSDSAANAALTGVTGPNPVWASSASNTPYTLVSNPPPSSNNNLSLVVVNGATRPTPYSYTLPSDAISVPVYIVTEETNAMVSILGTNLSGRRDLSGSLPLAEGLNSFTVQVVAQDGFTTATYTLAITNPCLFIDTAFITANTPLVKGTTYRLVADLTMTAPFTFSPNGTGPITVNGGGHTITVPDQWPGLFSQAVTVSNLGILSTGQAQNSAGYFFANTVDGTAKNCYSTGAIGNNGGGIFGSYCYYGYATNCYSTGAIGNYGGGIHGTHSTGGYARNCYSTGAIGTGGGGILGINSLDTTRNCYFTNGGLWSDADANAQLTGFSTVWFRYNNVVDTPYLLVSNPQPPSDDVNLLTVVVNGSTRVASNGAYAYTFDSSAATIPVLIRSEDPHAIVSIQDLSGGGDVSGNLTLVPGANSFTIQVVSDSGVATASYPLTIHTLSNDDDISSVSVNGATVDISNGIYDVTLPTNAASIPVRIITDDPNARIAIQGTDLSGTHDLSGSLSLPNEGPNLFTIAVVAPNGANATYLLTIRNPRAFLLIDQAFVTAGTALLNNATYTVVGDLTMTTPFSFSGSGTGITFDGSGHTITVPDQWPGLFNRAITVSNLGILSTGQAQNAAGYFFANGVGGTATNCYSTGSIGPNGGGIFGRASTGSAINCYSTGGISPNGGGVFGRASTGTATNCHSTGTMYEGAGGIFGYACNGTATNCHSTGTMNGGTGGIFGGVSSGTAINCYSTGDGAGSYCGGIFGSFSTGSAINCYSRGAISSYGGGIFGSSCNSIGSATNCYSTGAIGNRAGGIIGYNSNTRVEHCYFTNGGLWSDVDANAQLTGDPGEAPPTVWFRYINVANTPYLLVSNPQSPNNDVNLLTVVVNGSTRVASNGTYAYTFDSSASTIPVLIHNEDSNAIINIQDLSGSGEVSGSLTGLVPGTNSFTIRVSGLTTATFPLTIQTLSNDDDISSVSVNGATVDISNGVYDVTLPTNVASTPFRIITDDPNARIAIEGTDLSGTYDLSGSLSLPITGSNLFTITVVAPNGANATYLLTITNPPPIIFIDSAFVTAGTALLNNANYIVVGDLTMTTPFSFSESGAGILFDGSGHTITVPDQWPGLFSKAVSVSNLGILSSGQTGMYAGWFFQDGIGGTATNCYSTGTINAYGGGIFGQGATGTATNCHSTGEILNAAGGIFGYNTTSCSATNCYSTGAISYAGGGIFGNYATSGSATNCDSTGTIGQNGGGIYGPSVNCSAINCYSTGSIDLQGGGIFGYSATSCTATACYSTGSIASEGGGIVGSNSFGSVTNCYSTGTVSGSANAIGNNVSATNCYSTNGGQWSDADANAPTALTGFSTVWFSNNNVANTPYLLVANPQSFSSNNNLSLVVVNGVTLTGSAPYSYSIPSNASSVSVHVVTEETNATVSILGTALSGRQDLSGSLPLVDGSNSFTIQVVAQNGSTTATYALAITNPSAILINQAFVTTGTALLKGNSYIVTENLTMTTPFSFSPNGSGAITIEGSGHTITVPDQWAGLFSQAVTVSNLGVLSTGFTVANAGWFFANGVGGTATNCYSTGGIGTSAGGIFGRASNGSATACYSTGAISQSGGGIFGFNSPGSATSCYSTGNISSGGAGGIFGSGAGSGTATNCYSTGSIGSTGGGIFGTYSVSTAINCYSTGAIGQDAGGIFGRYSGGTATNCYSTGTLGQNTGGIFGAFSTDTATATNCYTTGTLGQNAGSIFGRYSSVAATTTNCYSTNGGLWSDGDANAQLTGVPGQSSTNNLTGFPGQPSTVWLRYNNVINTPYLLVANPQPPSNNVNLLTVVVNGSTRISWNNSPYSCTFVSSETTIPVLIRSEDPHAIVSIQDLSGGGNVSGSLTGLVPGANFFTIMVVSDSGVATATYTLKITTFNNTLPNNDVNLLSVVVNGNTQIAVNGAYAYAFDSSATTIPVVIRANDPNANVRIQNLPESNEVSGNLTGLIPSTNSFTIQVIAEDGMTTATYPLTITRPLPITYINQAFVTARTALVKRNAYVVTENLTMTTPFSMISAEREPITFDGSGYTITVPGNWGGLFSRPVTVSNLGILSSGSTRASVGWFFAGGVAGTATNCYSTGAIGANGGGIFGTVTIGSSTATNCYSTGAIGTFGGGILGRFSNGTVTNCYSTGTLGLNAGGILGSTPNVATTATNCYFTNGGLWSDTAANAQLTGVPGQLSPVWLRYNNVADTPYLLVANPQPPSDNDDLLSVVVNGSTQVASNGSYDYTFDSNASTIPVLIRSEDPHAIVSIQDLTGGGDVSGNLTGLVPGANFFTITVVSDSGVATATYPLTITRPLIILPIDQAFVTASTALLKGNSYIVTENLTMTTPFSFSPNGTGAITIEGSGHTITVPGNWAGLFSQDVSVSNLGVLSTGSTQDYAGWFFQPGVGGTAQSCYSTGAIGTSGGGLFGNQSSGVATNCFSTGAIGNGGGGIFGAYSQTASATNCYSRGAIDENGAGIFGIQSTGNAINCYSTGTIGTNGGGIFSSIDDTISITNCYSTNGGQWSDTAANAQLIGYPGQPSPVWLRYNNVANTPYLLVENPQPPSITPPAGPSAPTLTTTTLTTQSVNLSWTTPTGATSYKVYESTDSWATSTLVASQSATTYRITTRRIGSSQFKVSAVNADGLEGALSIATASITLLWSPASPTQVVATSSASGTVNLSWTPPTDTGNSPITSYRVYRAGGIRISTNITFNASSATLTGLATSIVYTFTVSSVNAIQEGSKSTPSNPIMLSILTSNLGNIPAFTTQVASITDPALAVLNARVAINNASNAGTLPPAERQALTVATLNALNTTGANKAIVTNINTNRILPSMASVNTTGTINPSLPVGFVIPSYSTGASPHTATLDLQSTLVVYGNTISYATMISQQLGYLVFELPNTIVGNAYQLTLTNGASSLTLSYDGTVLYDQNSNIYTANSVLQVGNLAIPLLGLGSIGTNTTSLALVTVNSSGPLQTPYAFTVASNDTSASVVIQAKNPQMSVIVRNSSGMAVLDGSLPNPGNVSGSLTSLVTGSNTFTINVTSQDGTVTTNYPLTITRPVAGPVPCFPAGTRILTPTGYKAVETLTQGELVLTADSRQVPVKIYGKHLEVTTSVTAPYRVPKGTFGLQNDLVLSPDHAFQIRKGLWMLPKRAALLSDRVEQVGIGKPVTYYHLECPTYLRDNLVVDGAVVESYGGKTKSPYTYSETLKGYTRSVSIKNITKA